MISLVVANAEAMEALGRKWAKSLTGGLAVYFSGDLGAGKTTLIRGLLHGLGHRGPVTSPTFTLVEPYLEITPPTYHFDLYRLRDPEELEMIGVRDMFSPATLCLVEWPERGAGVLPKADIEVEICHIDEQLGGGRQVRAWVHNHQAPVLIS